MSVVEGDLHAALMARVEAMATALSYTVLYPQKGGDQPAGEHVTAFHLPNDNQRGELAGEIMERQGFLVLTLVSPLNIYEVVTKRKAGELAAYFINDLELTSGDVCVAVTGHTVKPGSQVGERWETPIWVSYWGMA